MQLLMQKLILITSLSRPINASDFTELGKNEALDLEYTAKRLRNAGDYDKISKLIDMLIEEFAKSPQANHRKGGLIGLAAVTIGLPSEAAQRYLEVIMYSISGGSIRYFSIGLTEEEDC